MARRRKQGGIVAVELALCVPVLLLLIIGGIHLTRAMLTQHRLSDAVDFATRTAAIAGQTNADMIEPTIRGRMATEATRCLALSVVAEVVAPDPRPSAPRALHVRATCELAQVMGIGPTRVVASAAMPL